jgi:hypothetical protein
LEGREGEVKRLGSEADHLLKTIAEVEKFWIYAFIPPYVFMAQGKLILLSAEGVCRILMKEMADTENR